MAKARKISVELRGRKTRYTRKLADRICECLALGMSLRETCRQKGFPGDATVRDWDKADRDGFSARYARAIEQQLLVWGDQIIEISDDGRNDYIERTNDDGSKTKTAILDKEHVQRSKLRIDARKWVLSKLMPKQYGDKTTLQHEGQDGGAIQVNLNAVDSKL